jgi:hypothetical protein
MQIAPLSCYSRIRTWGAKAEAEATTAAKQIADFIVD